MRTITMSLAVMAVLSSMSTALIYNKTAAYAPGNYNKYKCITTEDVNKMVPQCLHQCQRDTNKADGCGYNDFACHCANYNVYAPLIEHCAFPPALGGVGTCTFAELGQIRAVVTDLCNFYNATGYMASSECQTSGRLPFAFPYGSGNGYKITPEKTFALVATQEISIVDEPGCGTQTQQH